MKILFLDDELWRVTTLREDSDEVIHHVKTAAEALARLGEEWDVICLDHDLAEDGDHNHEKCGCVVAAALHELRNSPLVPRPVLPKLILVHSWNSAGALRMLVFMDELDPIRIPFGGFTFKEGAVNVKPGRVVIV